MPRSRVLIPLDPMPLTAVIRPLDDTCCRAYCRIGLCANLKQWTRSCRLREAHKCGRGSGESGLEGGGAGQQGREDQPDAIAKVLAPAEQTHPVTALTVSLFLSLSLYLSPSLSKAQTRCRTNLFPRKPFAPH